MRINLTQGQVALVDDADFDMLSKFKWSARWCPKAEAYYAIATVSMGRLVLGLTDSNIMADHRNHDTLDNRRDNLRAATRSQNKRNANGARADSKSGVRGVSRHKQTGKWHAWLRVGGRLHSLGLHKHMGDAAKARLKAEKKYFGEFAGPLVKMERK